MQAKFCGQTLLFRFPLAPQNANGLRWNATMATRLNVGEEFPLEAKLLDAKRSWLRERTRSAVVLTFLSLGCSFLLGAAVYGLFVDRFEALSAVWNAIEFPLGMVFGYYLPGRNE